MKQATPPPRYADVALPLPLDQPLTYEVPEALRERAQTGMRAIVPLKRRTYSGYIVALKETSELDGPRPIVDLPDETPVFSAHILKLCRWIADYYCCSLGEALQTAAPAALRGRATVRYVLQPGEITSGRYTERQRAVIAALHRDGGATEGQLAKAVGGGALSNTLQSLVRRGLIRAEPVVEEGGGIRTETWVRIVDEAVPAPEDIAKLQRRAPRQAAVYLDLLHGDSEQPATAVYARHEVDSGVLRALERKGLLERYDVELYRTPDVTADEGAAQKRLLNAEQQVAYDALRDAVEAGRFQTFLLHGVTGSGKTEVYLQIIERVLELGRDAVILVPEISLTPQTVGRFKARFHEDIAVLHSGLSAGERYDEWRRAQRGEVRIVVGARSAIFAPLPQPGVIIVDEEHDASYKQGDAPRYHARDVAVMRAHMLGAVCVIGSATPSIESYHNAEGGRYGLLTLARRATTAEMPAVRLVDMRAHAAETGQSNAMLSPELEAALAARVAAKEQALLLLNRRGFSPFVLCPQCGWTADCEDCNVTLTYHAKGGCVACHYCNLRRDVPQLCESCGFHPLLFMGAGTQKVEDVLGRTFPEAAIARMDADTTSGKGGHARILGRLANGEIDILVGTQMIAKGHDYPRVTLVGVLSADTGLGLPDFRAAETTFQLLTQVAGRAGRADRPGEVIIQTYRPRHYAVAAAAAHDYAAFYAKEKEQRRSAGYPPFRRLANLAVEGEDPEATERAALALHRTVREQRDALGYRGVEAVGPAPATIHRVRKQYRWNIGLLSKSHKRLNRLLRATRASFDAGPHANKARLKLDLDPYGLF